MKGADQVDGKDATIEALSEQNRILKAEIKALSEELDARRKELGLSRGELKKIIISLRESEDKYRHLFESMNEGMALLRLIYDDSGRAVDYVFLDVNKTYEVIMGADREARIGRRASECYGQAAHMEIYGRVDATGKPARFYSYSPQLQKHFSVSAFSPGRGEVAIVFLDITEHRHSDDLNRALSEISLSINSSPCSGIVINTILSISLGALGADIARLYTSTDDNWDILFAYSPGEGFKKSRVSREEAELIALIARGNKPMAITDVRGDARIDNRALNAEETRSLLAAPIHINNKFMGVIVFYYSKPVKRFTWAQIHFTDRLSAMLSLALANSRLYESLQQKFAERKRLEESLREIALNAQMRAAMLEATIAAMGEGVVIYGNKGNIVRMNEYARNIFGYSQEDIEKPITDRISKTRLFSPDGILQKQEDNPVYRAMRGEVLMSLDYLLLNGSGEELWVSISAAPLKNETGALFGAVITLNDITERKKAEEVVKLNEARLETLVMLNDMAGAPEEELFDFALQSALKITESSFGEVFMVSDDDSIEMILSIVKKGRTGYETLCGSHHLTRNSAMLAERLRTRRPIIINDYSASDSLKMDLPDGHIPFSRIMQVPVIEADHIVAACLVANKETDYTEADAGQLTLLMSDVWRIVARKRAEHELFEAKKQAELYLDLMGHDISNIHQIAIGYLELAGEFPEHATKDKSVLDKPLEALQRSAQLIDNVRKLQKIRTGDISMRAIDLDEVLAGVIDTYQGYNVSYTAACGDRPHQVLANELLYEVFSNIVGNAVKHSGRKDVSISITVSLARVSERAYYRVCVDDDGPGISDRMKEKIFNRLQKGDTGARGMGLGLYLVRMLVESYQGWVSVEDRLQGDYRMGSRFVIMLPRLNP